MLLKYYSVVILCLSIVNGEPGEPKCLSRFDYDEKMLMKQLRFEDKVQKFEDFINGVKAREAKEKEERDELFAAELDKVTNFQEFMKELKSKEEKETEERSKLFAAELHKLEKYKQENAEEVERQKNVTSEMLESVANSKTEFENIHKQINETMKEKVVAFTMTTPKVGATSGSMSFTTVVTNEGNGFDTSTGKFTCPVSGLYFFSLHIIKKRASVDYAGCYIYLNGSSKVRAYIDPQDGANGADIGSYGVSTSVYLKLKVGDVVTLENCSGTIPSAVEPWTSFSGYLERQV
ncbi:heavy metal-binding protein HIP-like [Ruditapes philippinarum]|uniref:heavy metal-binding protein HIP-like n=1 Tax=Ruditapes philippinarum TaxID=129788 RepID=UPI00295C293A|nr:heavy metal-binding protein HIP-like [Ruditapes philippinarum]